MTATTAARPAVLVVLVAHDGVDWLPEVLDGLLGQTCPSFDVVAVDNASTDGSRELLVDRLGEQRVLVADRDIGFGAAFAMALDAAGAEPSKYVLALHDDAVLAPDAIEILLAAAQADPHLGAVGVKLVEHEDPERLQSVGWTIDVTGRANSGVDPGELDQGQRDHDRAVLYVSSAAMLLRRSAFLQVGGFDRRYHVFRDDLDLCWRLHLAGYDVEVAPSAVARHVAGASTYRRLGQTRFIGPRYFAERNTLATLLKDYGALRLVRVLPLFLLVGVAKVLGFLFTRRISDAWQTIRAWLWNVLHLRETWRFRREVQHGRVRSDAQLAPLFGRIGPRLRAYLEAMASWATGGDVTTEVPPPMIPARGEPPRSFARRALDLLRRRPSLVAGVGLSVLFVAAVWPLLLPGALRGGELAPWPASPAAFLSPYVAGLNDAGAFGTSQAASPAQAVLGVLHLAVGGSAYLAPRALLLLPLVVGWVFALRAAQRYSTRRPPRVVAATAYVLSPPVLAALVRGDVGALVCFAALPALLVGGLAIVRRDAPPAAAWRAVAVTALVGTVAAAFEPLVGSALVVLGGAVVLVTAVRSPQRRWVLAVTARVSIAVLAPFVLLLPWSIDATVGVLTTGVSVPVGDPVWRWLVLAPRATGFAGLWAGGGFVLAGALGFVFGLRRSPWLVASLLATALGGGVAAWWLDRVGSTTWAGLPLLVTAAAYAGLFAVAFAQGEAQLSRHAFGWRQLSAATTLLGVAVSLGVVASALLSGPWDRYAVGEPALPSYVAAEADGEAFRVLVLAVEGRDLDWEVVDGTGPTMAAYGVPLAAEVDDWVGGALDGVISGQDPHAVDRLGQAGIRYVVVPPDGAAPALTEALNRQVGAAQRPVSSGEVYQLTGWLPLAVALPAGAAEEITAGGAVPGEAALDRLAKVGPGEYVGELGTDDVIQVAEPNDGAWQATVGGTTLPAQIDALVRFSGLPQGEVVVRHTNSTARGLAVTGQLLAVLLTISLALRPPRFARAIPVTEERS